MESPLRTALARQALIIDFCGMTSRFLLCLIIISMAAGCSQETFQSKWHAPKADDGTFRFYHADSRIRYNVSNDSTHLYLKMDVTDKLTMMKILQTGLRIFLGAEGKKKERNEIQFPIYVDKYELTKDDMNPAMTPLERSGQLERLLPTEGYRKFNGSVVQVFNGAPLADGTQVLIRFDTDRALVYEAVIPLALLNPSDGQVAIGIETGAFKLPSGEVIQQTDITSQQQLTSGDRAMGRGQGLDPFSANNPNGMNPTSSANMGMNQRALTRYNVVEDPVRFWVNVQLAKVQ